MKKFAIAVGLLVVAGAIWSYNVLRADQEPVSATPSPVEAGRQKLHDQLAQSAQREAEIEQQDWNSVTLLRALVAAHQERIQKLTGNSEAGEILAHDRDAVARLQKRVNDLVAQEAMLPPVGTGNQADAGSAANSGSPPAGAKPPASTSPQVDR
ncbi:MAG TPA: hypothetical protein VKB38_12330 [Terracidiphilus sp.]|nr:hypothetical protein [Terracidiphilus sp.]